MTPARFAPTLGRVHPVLITLPNGAPMYSYGAALGFSFFVGWYLTGWLARRDGVSGRDAVLLFFVTALTALVGSKILFLVTTPGSLRSAADLVRGSGFVAYGGFLGGAVGGALFARARGVPVGVWADAAAPSLCSGLSIVRVGCLLAGCDYGVRSNGPLAVHFPPGSPAFVEQRVAGLVAAGAPASLGVLPTQVFESLAGALLLGLVFVVRARRRRPGDAFLAFGLGYAGLRFCIEFVRGDADRGLYGPFSTSQWIALATATAAAAFLIRRRATTT